MVPHSLVIVFFADELLDRNAGGSRQLKRVSETADTSSLYPLVNSRV